ncbi:Ubiquitin thioesterase OTU1 [Durusdinium trenchii]|uniref:Ubiquitin thioesterase OTU1 n=1 Tax=Durusdinium trenchii TaxID=1381693 RepID=A0ABP0KED1_9DINO
MVRKNGSQLLEVWSPVDMDDDEPERPSTSWEPTKAYLGREELSLEEIEGVRERFREQCIRQHGSVVRAWKVMDLNADGRLSYFEFMRGCKQMSVANPRRVWRALGRTGLLTLRCVDPRLGEQLGTLATAIWFNCGSVENAWRSCFNKRSKLRISSEDFSEACQELRYQGDPVACFGELCSEKASNGMSRKEFGFLHSWMSPKGHPDRGFLDAPISKWAVPAEPWTPPPIVQKRDARL